MTSDISDFNINCLDYTTNSKTKKFMNHMFSKGMLSVVNRPTRVTKTSSSCIDHIYINSYFDRDILSGIIKTDLTDHFPIFITDNNLNTTNFSDKITKNIRIINEVNIAKFKKNLSETNWSHVTESQDPDDAYNIFLKHFLIIYDNFFPVRKIEIKRKNLMSPWITRGLVKSSKRKQKLYEKFLKNKTFKNEQNYKKYKHLFERIKLASRKQHFSSLLLKHQNNAKKTWDTIKEAIGKTKIKSNNFPRKITINKNETFDEDLIANTFNKYFVNVGPDLARNIPSSEKHFTDYIHKTDKTLDEKSLTLQELETAFKTLKTDKASGFDEINPNVVKSAYNEITIPFFHICKISLEKSCFPEKMKIAKITPLFKSGETDSVSNYRPISILPVFSKILERIMYNRVYTHISENLLLYEKQFGFQQNCSTDYAILQLTKEIYESLEKKEFTLGVFVDLSKAFDTVDHDILIKKLSYFGIKNKHLKWFKSYISNRQQYISYNNNKHSNILKIKCGVPQGSILGPLLFLLYINDMQNASRIFQPIMFADDTNLFYSHKNIKHLFRIVNQELKNIHTWFNANKLSINLTKTKYSFFHSSYYNDLIPLRLPRLEINNNTIKRETVMKFLGVLLDENLNWKDHIHCIENKISKNIGILYKARLVLNEKSTKQLYFSFINSYLNYGNIAWGSTSKTNLKILFRRQKHASRIIYFKDKVTHARPLMKSFNALNIYQLNIYQILLFMHKVKNNNIFSLFKRCFSETRNKYNTKATETTFSKPFFITKRGQYIITFRGPQLWNALVPKMLHDIPFHTFKLKIKKICLELEDDKAYF